MDPDERRIVDSRPVQRLRAVHQLALSYLIYPGATHRRFEHSLGVMELAGRVFDVITDDVHLPDQARDEFAEHLTATQKPYWRRVVRIAALCHDIGHIPFSHGVEHDLLPGGHEQLTRRLIESDFLPLHEITPPVRSDDVVKLAVGAKGLKEHFFSPWERILAEIIVGDAFGVDRIDYLLRDSYHAGVAYGRFDHYRLIDSLRVLPSPQEQDLTIGIDEGGLNSAEALLLARYFMFTQVYFHPVRLIFDRHLSDFMRERMFAEGYPLQLSEHLRVTDNEVLASMSVAVENAGEAGHESAHRVMTRSHYKRIYSRDKADIRSNPDATRVLFDALEEQFPGKLRLVSSTMRGGLAEDFPVRTSNGTVVPAIDQSDVLEKLPDIRVEYIFISPDLREPSGEWIKNNKKRVLGS